MVARRATRIKTDLSGPEVSQLNAWGRYINVDGRAGIIWEGPAQGAVSLKPLMLSPAGKESIVL